MSHWVAEGVQNAKDSVYTGPVGAGAGPFSLTDDYKTAAKALAKKQVALVGARLANLLNSELKSGGKSGRECCSIHWDCQEPPDADQHARSCLVSRFLAR